MTHRIDVIYENGVLRPLDQLPAQIRERQRYTVTLEASNGAEPWRDTACIMAAARDANAAVGLEEVRKALAKIPGSLAGAVHAEREDR